MPIERYYGTAQDDFADTGVATGSLRVEHRTSRQWLLRQVVRVGVYDTSFSNTAPTGTTLVNGVWRVSRQQYTAEQAQRNAFSQSEVVVTARAAGMQHLLLAGLELERKHTHAHEVRAMDSLEALRDDSLHAEELRALGSPVA